MSLSAKLWAACATWFAVGCVATMLITQVRIEQARDQVARIQEQYRACSMVGDLPTTADMLTQESGQ